MTDERKPPGPKSLQIQVNNDTLGGVYANNVSIAHTREEFILDFFSVFPPAGKLVSRVIVSPAHMKRLLRAMTENLTRYESAHGTIPETVAPPAPEIVH